MANRYYNTQNGYTIPKNNVAILWSRRNFEKVFVSLEEMQFMVWVAQSGTLPKVRCTYDKQSSMGFKAGNPGK